MNKLRNVVVSLITLCALLSTQMAKCQKANNELINIIEVADFIKEKEPKPEKKEKNFMFTILGGPGYNPDYGFLVGGSTLMTFYLPGMKEFGKRSVLPINFSMIFDEKVYYSATMYPQLFLHKDRIRITGDFKYTNLLSNYYGVGFTRNKSTTRGSNTTQYMHSEVVVNPTISFRMRESNWFLGLTFNLQRDEISSPSQMMIDDEDYISVGGDASGFVAKNEGLGFTINYDSRDVSSNAYRGIYLDLRGVAYDKYFGGESNFTTLQFKYRQYVQLSKIKEGRTLAWSVTSDNVFGDAPFTMLATVGSAYDLRGYYQGQYRDKSAHTAIVEYRHKFNMDPKNFVAKMINKSGFVVWMGSGLLGSSPLDIEGVLPNYGAGYRFEVQPRMNFRVDVGRSPIEKQTLFYISMTEAF